MNIAIFMNHTTSYNLAYAMTTSKPSATPDWDQAAPHRRRERFAAEKPARAARQFHLEPRPVPVRPETRAVELAAVARRAAEPNAMSIGTPSVEPPRRPDPHHDFARKQDVDSRTALQGPRFTNFDSVRRTTRFLSKRTHPPTLGYTSINLTSSRPEWTRL